MVDVTKTLEMLRARADDPEYQREYAEAEAQREQAKRLSAWGQRRHLLERSGIPLRVGLIPKVCKIPRCLDVDSCQCGQSVISHMTCKCIIPDGYEETPCVALVRGWLDARRAAPRAWKPLLVILGGTGIGKTTACAWAYLVHEGGVYVKSRALTIAHRSMFGDEARAWNTITRDTFAIIDDVGRESDEHGVAAFEDLVDERQAKATIITANMGREEFFSRFGGRVQSRLAESGVVQFVKDVDRRRQA